MSRNLIYALTAAAVAAVAIVAVVLIAGGGGGDEDPREVLDATFSGDKQVDSGVFDASLDVEAEGGNSEGKLEATVGGPFQGAEGKFPSFQIEAEADLEGDQDFSGSLGVTSTGDAAFVNFQGTDYQVPEQAFNQFSSSFTRLQDQSQGQGGEDGNLLSALDINPSRWLTDLSNKGDEDVEGAETIHISGEADVPKLVEDLKRIAQNAPQATGQFTPEQLGELDRLTELVESADFDIYSGAEDRILRRLDASLELNPPDEEDAPDSLTIDFSITLSDLNEPQEIEAPADARPLGDLLQAFGIDPGSLGQLGEALGGQSGGGAPQAGGAPEAPSDSSSRAYLDCLATAEGADAVQQCAELLEQ